MSWSIHQLTARPGYVDEDGPAQLVRCPDCGQMEWWTVRETQEHGYCRSGRGRYRVQDCPAC